MIYKPHNRSFVTFAILWFISHTIKLIQFILIYVNLIYVNLIYVNLCQFINVNL